MARLLGVLFMRESWGEVPFLAEGENKDSPPEWAPLRPQLGLRWAHVYGTCQARLRREAVSQSAWLRSGEF